MFYRVFVLLAIVALLSGCSEINMDLTTAISVQQQIISDNKDANDASECIVSFDTKLGTFNGEFRDTIVIEVGKDCIQEVVKKKIDDSEKESE